MFWLVIKISSFKKNFVVYFSHYTTTATPFLLVPFINLVELIRNVIRPLTLGIRLAVKLLTGHLLLNMFSSFHSSQKFVSFFFFFFFGLFLFFYETCVSIIQALVFKLMLFQYLDEHSSNSL